MVSDPMTMRWVRTVHLFLGLVATPFILLYALSGVFYAHHSLAPTARETTDIDLTIDSLPSSAEEVARVLSIEFGIRGKLDEVVSRNGSEMQITIHRPGTWYVLTIDQSTGGVTGKVTRVNAAEFVTALHVTAGIADQNFPEALWGVAALIIATCLMGLIVTGFVLWFKRSGARRAGTLFISLSLLYAGTILIFVRLS
jgi:hypothetical protein